MCSYGPIGHPQSSDPEEQTAERVGGMMFSLIHAGHSHTDDKADGDEPRCHPRNGVGRHRGDDEGDRAVEGQRGRDMA